MRRQPYNILVTGVGAVIGYGIVRALRASRFQVRVTGMDVHADAVGQTWCDTFEQARYAASPEYPDFIQRLIRQHAIDLVIPGIEQDLERMSLEMVAGGALGGLPCRWALNRPELIRISGDKWLTHQALQQTGFPVIPTFIDGDFTELAAEFGTPLLVKPRRSYASKGIERIHDAQDFAWQKAKRGADFMVQPIVGSAEYTVSVFGLGDGEPVQQIALERRLGPDGATSKATLRQIPALEKRVNELVRLFRPEGPTNLQFRFHDGEYLLLEINPRISSATSIRTAFGFNEAEMCIEYFIEGARPAWRELRPGRAERFLEDHITYFQSELLTDDV